MSEPEKVEKTGWIRYCCPCAWRSNSGSAKRQYYCGCCMRDHESEPIVGGETPAEQCRIRRWKVLFQRLNERSYYLTKKSSNIEMKLDFWISVCDNGGVEGGQTMLTKISLENFRSFEQPAELTMVSSTKIRSNADHRMQIKNTRLLRHAVVYGANASGRQISWSFSLLCDNAWNRSSRLVCATFL